ncbi:MAG: tRNA (adenosine(37)-N6)-dimethylallyltransferase MiaA [Clostridiales bacterium]|nr:tRNA (adenosine(37)-N6)-dimethylallyltransferase MiaA [Clostridiales bacterium]
MPKVLVICGATASGKTSLAVSCAEKLNTEIISADSMLVYKQLDVGTAKPTKEEKRGILHHMIDVVEPSSDFSVNDYEKMALPIVEKLLLKGKTPIICGGTGFYIQSLLYKSQFGNVGANLAVREKYERLAEEKGVEYVHGLLAKVDNDSALKLHPNDLKRVIRALEIYEITGKAKSAQNDKQIPRFDFLSVSIEYPRETLYKRINLRVEQMFESGLKEEVQSLLNNGVTTDMQCMQGIGYKEVAEGLQNGWTDGEIIELIQKNTRNYAKRQQTFFKRMQNHVFLSYEEATAEKVLALLKN